MYYDTYDTRNRNCVKRKIYRQLSDDVHTYDEEWIPVEKAGAGGGEVWECVAVVKNGKLVYKPIRRAEEPETKQTALRTNHTANNSVKLDPMRLRFTYPDGVPGNPTVNDILRDPERWADVWQALDYILTGTVVYRDERERKIDELIDRIMND